MTTTTNASVPDGAAAPVRTSGLTKRYGTRITAVDDLDLHVHAGEVYGFLGPNGAGKTTTLRMLVGLVRSTSGSAQVFGLPAGHPASLARVGALIESPDFYPYLSGRDNLVALTHYAGLARARADAVLETVELTDRAGDPFATYSLGMKQRLGVAAALLKDPDLLILDEPTNGLDPQGMRDMRTLLRGLGAAGRTVLLSSHLLGEVQQVCDRVGVIAGGRLIREATVGELRGRGDFLVAAEPITSSAEALRRLLGPDRVATVDGTLRLQVDDDDLPAVHHALVAAHGTVTQMRRLEPALEDVFLDMTRNDTTDKEPHHAR